MAVLEILRDPHSTGRTKLLEQGVNRAVLKYLNDMPALRFTRSFSGGELRLEPVETDTRGDV